MTDRVVQAALKLVLEPIFEADFEPVSYGQMKAKIRAATFRTSQSDLTTTLIRLNQMMRGWVNYFKHAVAKRTFDRLRNFTWWRIVRWQRTRHRWNWGDVRRWLTTPTGAWRPITSEGIELFNPAAVPIVRYRYRGNKIPKPYGVA